MPQDLPSTTTQPPQSLPPSQSVPESDTPPRRPFQKKTLLIGFGILLFVALTLGMIMGGGKSQKDTTTPTPSPTKQLKQPSPTPTSGDSTLVYAARTGKTTIIKSVDLSSSTTVSLATFPLEIKKVDVISNTTLIYIDQTDPQNYGRQIRLYDINTKATKFSIPASKGFGITDYFLSSNKKFLVMSEVSLPQKSQNAPPRYSRIYAVDLSRPTVKNLLYDEELKSSANISYPRGILNNGTVFVDMFFANDPNEKTNWGHGMNVVDFDGRNKKTIESVQSDTYGTRPSLSPDGTYILFAGYHVPDENEEKTGQRLALINPNTVDLLNTKTLKRFQLPNLDAGNIYAGTSWSTATENIILTIKSADSPQTDVYIYDLSSETASKIPMPSTYSFLSQLNKNTAFIGIPNTNPSNLGNVGESTRYAFTQFALLDISTAKMNFIALPDPFAHYITTLPGNYFK